MEKDDDSDSDEVVHMHRKKKRTAFESESESDPDDELPELSDLSAAEAEEPITTNQHPVGSFVVAVYDRQWYIGQVEAEEPEEESRGFTLLNYMERRGHNQFVWGQRKDQLKTNNKDILLRVTAGLVPVSGMRIWGLPKGTLKEVEELFRVKCKWSIISFLYLYYLYSEIFSFRQS